MQVDSDVVALESSSATQLQLLTDLCGELLGSVSCGLTVEVSCCELFRGVCLDCCGSVGDLVGEVDELLVLGNEVGLGVDLDHGVTRNSNQALGSGALCTLADVLCALNAQDLDSLVEIAVGLDECVLTSLHAGAGQLTELLDVSSSEIRHAGRSSLWWLELVVVRKFSFTQRMPSQLQWSLRRPSLQPGRSSQRRTRSERRLLLREQRWPRAQREPCGPLQQRWR